MAMPVMSNLNFHCSTIEGKFVVFSSIGAFTYYCLNAYIQWRHDPVILRFDQQPTNIFEIPLPAVSNLLNDFTKLKANFYFQITICPNLKFDKRNFDVKQVLNRYELVGHVDRRK
jgi:hypothetical protein